MKPDLCTNEKSHIAYEILTYLAEHPDSSDSLEGIAQWWLLERKIKHQIANVKKAIAELVSKGLVIEYSGRDSRTHYRINKLKHEEIQVILRQRSDDMRRRSTKYPKRRS